MCISSDRILVMVKIVRLIVRSQQRHISAKKMRYERNDFRLQS